MEITYLVGGSSFGAGDLSLSLSLCMTGLSLSLLYSLSLGVVGLLDFSSSNTSSSDNVLSLRTRADPAPGGGATANQITTLLVKGIQSTFESL